MSRARSQSLFDMQYLTSAMNSVHEIVTHPYQMVGNKVVLALFSIWYSGSESLTFEIQGSYDGINWVTIGSAATLNTMGPATTAAANVDYAFVRAAFRISTATTTTKTAFSAAFVFSEQGT